MVLYFKNTFNSANWNLIKGALVGISIPEYLPSLVENDLSERTLRNGKDEGHKEHVVIVKMPVGSLLGSSCV